jgi:uncharacterized membrane protein AbrB (regulator of aidB expression)
MKRFFAWALLALALLAIGATIVFAQTEGGADDKTVGLIFTLAASAAGVIAGWIFKQSPVPNGFIPGVMGVIAVVAIVALTDITFKAAVIAAMGIVGGAVTIYETGKQIKSSAAGGGS